MAAKLIAFENEARFALKKGVDHVANAVKKTLGPRGRNVAIDRRPHSPLVTHDGVTVAKDIELFDPFENMGAQIVKAAALRTNDVTGDGTTTATVIAQAIVSEGIHAMTNGANPMMLQRGFDWGVGQVGQLLRQWARPVQGREDIAHVATIASADADIGGLLADLLDQVGKDGVVAVQESPVAGVTTEYQEGLEIDKGWISPYFITDQSKQEAVLEDTLVFITGRKIEKIGQIVPLLERVLASGEKSLFIIADDVDGEALSTLVLTKLHGKLNIAACKPPGYGDRRKLELEDLAALTGAQVLSEDTGVTLDQVTPRELGRARRVVVGKDRTIVSGGVGSDTAVQQRIRTLRSVLVDTPADYDREWIQKRLARLSNGIGVIRVGAGTKVEAEEKKMRVDDALGATRAAIAEGILPGGGVALTNAAWTLAQYTMPGDQGVGLAILRRALEEPMRLLAENAGTSGSVVVETIRQRQLETGNANIGYNVVSGTYSDMYEAGIIDPVRVVRVALENAVSVASLILTTEALVAEPYEWPKPPTMKHPSGRPY
jgi:chaperonin GroEL